jgi:hypothetical protein
VPALEDGGGVGMERVRGRRLVEWSELQCKGSGRDIGGRERGGGPKAGQDRTGQGGAQRTSFRFPSSRAYSSSTSCSSGESVSDVSEPRLVERCSSFSDAIVVVFCAVVVVMAVVGGSGFWVLGAQRVCVFGRLLGRRSGT